MSLLNIVFAALTLTLGGTPQAAGQPPQEPPPTVLEDVVVNGIPLRDAIDIFVDEITEPPRGHGPARWDRRVCVGVVNLRRDAAQMLIDRVSETAGAMGLEPGEPGCNANILVIATDEPTSLAGALIEAKPRVFRPGYSGAPGLMARLKPSAAPLSRFAGGMSACQSIATQGRRR